MKKTFVSVSLVLLLFGGLLSCTQDDEETGACSAIDNQMDCEADSACLWNKQTSLCEAISGEGEGEG